MIEDEDDIVCFVVVVVVVVVSMTLPSLVELMLVVAYLARESLVPRQTRTDLGG